MSAFVLSPSMLAALERGQCDLQAYRELQERGTAEDIAADEIIRGSAVRWDILKRRALFPVIEPTQGQLWANAERLLKAGQITPWGDSTISPHVGRESKPGAVSGGLLSVKQQNV